MTTSSRNDYPTIGFDPAPGDVDATTAVGATLQSAAASLTQIADVLHGAAEGHWEGKSATAFRDLLAHDFRPKIDAAQTSFEQAARAVGDWASDMSTYQVRARAIEARAAAAQAAVNAASGHLASIPAPLTVAPTSNAAAQADQQNNADRSAAQSALTSATADLAQARQDAHHLLRDYEALGVEIATRLQHATDIAPHEPGWFDRMVSAIGHAMHNMTGWIGDAMHWVSQTLKDLAPLIKLIADISSMLGSVCGILALIPGLQFLAPFALGFGLFALVGHYLSGVSEKGWFGALFTKDMMFDTLAVAGGLGALRAGEATLKAAEEAGQETRLVPQLIGRAKKLPLGYYGLATAKRAYSMSDAEMYARIGNYYSTWAGNVSSAAGSRTSIGIVRDMVTGHLTPAPAGAHG